MNFRFVSCAQMAIAFIAMSATNNTKNVAQIHVTKGGAASDLPEKPVPSLKFPRQFFDLVTKKMANQSAQCMGGIVFTQNMNGHEYYRSTGAMSNGYYYGTLLTYGRAFCNAYVHNKSGAYYDVLRAPPVETPNKTDSLLLFSKGNEGVDPVTLQFGMLATLGQIESDGTYNEGRDMAAWNIDGYSAEAGVQQASYDSHRAWDREKQSEVVKHVSDEVYKFLMDLYATAGDRGKGLCLLEVFKINRPSSDNTADWGSGAGRKFQSALKSCPGLAQAYQAYLNRMSAGVNGPVSSMQAQPKKPCLQVMQAVAKLLADKAACAELEQFAEFSSTARNARLAYPDFDYPFGADSLPYYEIPRGAKPYLEDPKGWSYNPPQSNNYFIADPADPFNEKKYKYVDLPPYSELGNIKTTRRILKELIGQTKDSEKIIKLSEKLATLDRREKEILTSKVGIQAALKKVEEDGNRFGYIVTDKKQKYEAAKLKPDSSETREEIAALKDILDFLDKEKILLTKKEAKLRGILQGIN